MFDCVKSFTEITLQNLLKIKKVEYIRWLRSCPKIIRKHTEPQTNFEDLLPHINNWKADSPSTSGILGL